MRTRADRRLRAACLAGLVVAALHGAVHAQSATAEKDYARVLERETAVRDRLTGAPGDSRAELLRGVRAVVLSYEAVANRYPRSGYSDNALWQAAMLAADAFRQFGDVSDRAAAVRLFEALEDRYPFSSLVKRATAEMARLQPPPALASTPVTGRSAAAAAPASGTRSTLRAIRREILPDVLRVTLELEHEASFSEGSLDGPPRVFVDLSNTAAVEALKGAVLAYQDDVIRQIRLGLHENARTRVVMDLNGQHRYSVYALYNPYRVVIDVQRPLPARASLARSSPAPAALPAVVSTDTESSAAAPRVPAVAAALAAAAMPSARTAVSGSSAAAPPAPAAGEPTEEPSASVVTPVPPPANGQGGYSLSRQLGLGISRIVVDPGHGGRDPGAQAGGMSEADLVLDVALRFEKLMLEEPGVEVVLTRRSDVYVPLEERTAIANRTKADLFLSIHANASANTRAVGVETYVLNFASNPEAEAIAARENAGSTRTMRELSDIVRAIATNNKIDESRDFASSVQRSLIAGLRRTNRDARNLGVKQAPFTVLVGAGMPGLLAEIGFLTNRQEGALLKTERYRQQIAESLATGVLAYQRTLKSTKTIAANE